MVVSAARYITTTANALPKISTGSATSRRVVGTAPVARIAACAVANGQRYRSTTTTISWVGMSLIPQSRTGTASNRPDAIYPAAHHLRLFSRFSMTCLPAGICPSGSRQEVNTPAVAPWRRGAGASIPIISNRLRDQNRNRSSGTFPRLVG
jgi:hypothetical protein